MLLPLLLLSLIAILTTLGIVFCRFSEARGGAAELFEHPKASRTQRYMAGIFG